MKTGGWSGHRGPGSPSVCRGLRAGVYLSVQTERLRESLKVWLRENTPPGSRLVITHDGFTELKVCCDGAVPISAYTCGLAPAHSGQCYSIHKHVYFDREN